MCSAATRWGPRHVELYLTVACSDAGKGGAVKEDTASAGEGRADDKKTEEQRAAAEERRVAAEEKRRKEAQASLPTSDLWHDALSAAITTLCSLVFRGCDSKLAGCQELCSKRNLFQT
jgi:hypothetical protein